MLSLENLTQRTLEIASGELLRRNKLNREHIQLLQVIARTLVDLAHGEIVGRYAVVAPCGVGKTTLIRALIQALAEGSEDTSLLVLQERIEAGTETVRDLVDMGVDRSLLAHVHSQADADSVDTAGRRRFVFATHARAKMSSIVPLLTYNDKPRAVIVDEALHASWAIGLAMRDLGAAVAWAKAYFAEKAASGRGDVEKELIAWAMETQKMVDEGLAKLNRTRERELQVTLPAPEDTQRGKFLHRLESAKHTAGQPLIQLIGVASVDARFRLVRVGKSSSAILQHRRVLPAEMQTCLVMDAGAQVDKLLALDDEIQLAHEVLPQFAGMRDPSGVKDWSDVEVHRMSAPGGRSTMREQYRPGNQEPWAPKAVAEFVRDKCPADGQVLLCTYKADHTTDYRRAQEDALATAGIDLSRIAWTHWGAHDATNEFQDAVAVVAAGVWQLDRLQVMAWALGQIDEPDAEIPGPEVVSDILDAWTAISLYQLAGRGVARTMDRGKAKPMVFGFIHRCHGASNYLRTLLPGAVEHVWPSPLDAQPKHVIESQTAKATVTIRKELERLASYGPHRISVKALRVRLGLGGMSPRVLSDAVRVVVKEGLWRRQGRTLEYIWAEA